MLKETDLANLKSDVNKLDNDQFKNVPSGLSNLKSKVDKLDNHKLVLFLNDLSKLTDVVKIDVVKKDVYNASIKNIEDKIPNFTNFVTTAAFNAKVNKVKGRIPSITNLGTTTALTAFENEISNVGTLVKKTDYSTKINENEKKITTDYDHDKYITFKEFHKLTSKNFAARLAQANLSSKNDIC